MFKDVANKAILVAIPFIAIFAKFNLGAISAIGLRDLLTVSKPIDAKPIGIKAAPNIVNPPANNGKVSANPNKPLILTLLDKSINPCVKAGITVTIAFAIDIIVEAITVPIASIAGAANPNAAPKGIKANPNAPISATPKNGTPVAAAVPNVVNPTVNAAIPAAAGAPNNAIAPNPIAPTAIVANANEMGINANPPKMTFGLANLPIPLAIFSIAAFSFLGLILSKIFSPIELAPNNIKPGDASNIPIEPTATSVVANSPTPLAIPPKASFIFLGLILSKAFKLNELAPNNNKPGDASNIPIAPRTTSVVANSPTPPAILFIASFIFLGLILSKAFKPNELAPNSNKPGDAIVNPIAPNITLVVPNSPIPSANPPIAS